MGQQTSRMEGEPCIHGPADQQDEGSPVFMGQQTSRMRGALYYSECKQSLEHGFNHSRFMVDVEEKQENRRQTIDIIQDCASL